VDSKSLDIVKRYLAGELDLESALAESLACFTRLALPIRQIRSALKAYSVACFGSACGNQIRTVCLISLLEQRSFAPSLHFAIHLMRSTIQRIQARPRACLTHAEADKRSNEARFIRSRFI
jgi:hypothetical protein